jgi:hypothetical protein
VSWRTAREVAVEIWEAEQENVDDRPWLRLLQDMIEDLTARGIVPARELSHFPLPPLEPLPAWTRAWLDGLRLGEPVGAAATIDFGALRSLKLEPIAEQLRTWRIA